MIPYATSKKLADEMGGDEKMVKFIEELAANDVIKSAKIKVIDKPLIHVASLWDYLDKCSQKKLSDPEKISEDMEVRNDLIKRILLSIELIGHKSIVRERYINLYDRSSSNRVYAQLHKPKPSRLEKYDGIFLVVPNGKDFDLSRYGRFSTNASIVDLVGDYGPNTDWLRGNGVRGTTSPAAILHIPVSMLEPEKNWNKINELLEQAQKKRM